MQRSHVPQDTSAIATSCSLRVMSMQSAGGKPVLVAEDLPALVAAVKLKVVGGHLGAFLLEAEHGDASELRDAHPQAKAAQASTLGALIREKLGDKLDLKK